MINNLIASFFGKFLIKREALVKAWFEYFSFKPAKIYWLVTVIINLFLWLLAFLIKRGLNQDLAILHYNITFGIDYLAPRSQVYFLPLIALVLFFINAGLSFIFLKKDKFIFSLLLISALALNALVGLGLYSIYLVNFVKIF